MVELKYRLSFNTPAFLGNAEQQAQWRTPPLKALLRQWWRVVKAPDVGYDTRRLLAAENLLFGAAGEEGKSWGKSRVQLRLDGGWSAGVLMPPVGDSVPHPESPVKRVAANTYLGYGPLGARNDRTALDPARAENTLRLRLPQTAAAEILGAVELASWFGGLGSRSRNGFGSLHWVSADDKTPALRKLTPEAVHALSLDYTRALQLDWPHAIGADAQGPLIWQTGPQPNWMAAMKQLAILKIGLRTSPPFKFDSGGNFGHPQPLARHVLAYPAGGSHSVSVDGWRKDGRMANQLRLRLHREGASFRGVIAHIPCGIPSHMKAAVRTLPDERRVWQTVHQFFDNAQELTRLGG